jgi:perosamine synthetase
MIILLETRLRGSFPHEVWPRDRFGPCMSSRFAKKLGLFKNTRCPVAERIGRQGFYLPSGLALRDEEIKHVARAMYEVIA